MRAPFARVRLALALTAGFATAALPMAESAPVLPQNFVAENLTPGYAFWVPTAIAFSPTGRLFVAEKAGRVLTWSNGVLVSTPLLDLQPEVLDFGDRGLLGIAVDPNHAVNRHIYLLYSVDPDSNGIDDNDDAFSRVTRYTISATDSNAIEPGSRRVLVGETWATGFASGSETHGPGALRWGRDGSLLVSHGDGGQQFTFDLGGYDPGLYLPGRMDPYENVGAFRSQMITSLSGKILRIDPATGDGLPSNPYWDGSPRSNASRVYAYGLRNPFRFHVRPGTGSPLASDGQPGTLYIGDVGWTAWDDLNVAPTAGLNFGWPCYEGFNVQPAYQGVTPAHHGCGTFGTAINPATNTPPTASWNHLDPTFSTPPGAIGNTQLGGIFYTGTRYPIEYWGRCFIADFGQSWLKVATMNAANQIQSFADFGDAMQAPVDFASDPISGDLHYVSIYTGEVRRIRWTGPAPNHAPVAVASVTPLSGVLPLTIACTSAGSTDEDMDPMTFSWSFGDGASAGGASVQHTFTRPGRFDVILSADDGRGGIGRDTTSVIAYAPLGYPTTAVLDAFGRPDGPLGTAWTGAANALTISAGRVARQAGGPALWATPFAAEQEAFATLAATGAGAELDLVLAAQGSGVSPARVLAHWSAASGTVQFRTFDPAQGFVDRGAPIPITLAAGDRLGARLFSNGEAEVWKGSSRIGGANVSGWPHVGLGGRIGLEVVGAATRADDFGGGNAILDPDFPPVVTWATPADSSFFVAGDSLRLSASATDDVDPNNLSFQWTVDLHHNTHVHPSTFSATGPIAALLAENHDDGTGVKLELKLAVSDQHFHTTRLTRWAFPENNLTVRSLKSTPDTIGTVGPWELRFVLRNDGRMPAPRSRWRVIANGILIAQGDTAVAALDSAVIVRRLSATLPAGGFTLRAVADTLAAVVETNETDNALTRALVVVTGAVPDRLPPLFTFGPEASPAATQAYLRIKTDEPANASVAFGTTPAFGDSVVIGTLLRDHVIVLPGLALGTRVYHRSRINDAAGNANWSAVDSFTTQPSTADVGPRPSAMMTLSAARPNPVSGPVAFALELPRAALVTFTVHDVAGRVVWRATRAWKPAGSWVLTWEGRDSAGRPAAPGLYHARVTADGRALSRAFVRVR